MRQHRGNKLINNPYRSGRKGVNNSYLELTIQLPHNMAFLLRAVLANMEFCHGQLSCTNMFSSLMEPMATRVPNRPDRAPQP